MGLGAPIGGLWLWVWGAVGLGEPIGRMWVWVWGAVGAGVPIAGGVVGMGLGCCGSWGTHRVVVGMGFGVLWVLVCP